MKKALVVYFSRSGYTQRIAEEIAARCGAEIERIQDARGRSGLLGYLRSAREALRKRAAEIAPGSARPSDYELVMIGTPVWAGNVSSPVRAYIAAHKSELRRVAFFCTQGGSGGAGVLADMAALSGQPAAANLVLNDRDIDKGLQAMKLRQFLETLTLQNAA